MVQDHSGITERLSSLQVTTVRVSSFCNFVNVKCGGHDVVLGTLLSLNMVCLQTTHGRDFGTGGHGTRTVDTVQH